MRKGLIAILVFIPLQVHRRDELWASTERFWSEWRRCLPSMEGFRWKGLKLQQKCHQEYGATLAPPPGRLFTLRLSEGVE